MLCARVMRGISSSANAVTPRDAMSRTVSGAPSGSAMPITICPCRISATSPGARPAGRRRHQTHQSRLAAICAPLSSYAAVGKSRALAGAPFDDDVEARFLQRRDGRGHERDTVLARKLFWLGDSDFHRVSF